ncbi:hypothetical protein A3850_010525 [Lewinella sp. 4G2]|nr:hypothetical protein A3850_010525 [Lewinella sp. 4G2]
MDAPQSKRFKELKKTSPDAGQKVIKSSIAGRRRSWVDRIFEIAGKKYEVVSLGERQISAVPTSNQLTKNKLDA